MTQTQEVAERYSAARTGFRLLNCEEAALPYFWVTLDALVQQKKRLPPLHEYVLKTIHSGLDSILAIAGILGIEEHLVERTAADLWERDLLDYPSLGRLGRSLRLTKEGLVALEELAFQGPERRELWIAFDRILWEPVLMQRHLLIPPRDLKQLDSLEIKPRRQARPELPDLDVGAIDKQLKKINRMNGEQVDVLAIHRVLRAERMFLPCHLLVYQSKDGKESEVGVAVDGRSSNAHDDALASLGGVSHLGITVSEPASETDLAIASALPKTEIELIRASAVPLESVERIRSKTFSASQQLEVLQRAEAIDSGSVLDSEVLQAEGIVESERQTFEEIAIREIDTFEHSLLFGEARKYSRKRLLVISPWISGKVVTKTFLDEIRRLAKKKVIIRIGYGISDDRATDERDRWAENELLKISREFENVVVTRLGDTHAKVLIWDDNLIITSFNWLSFSGDRNRTYRQEVGTLVKVKKNADDSWLKHSTRIESASKSR